MPIILDGTTGITTPGITNTGTFVFQGPVQVPAGSAATASITTAAGANTGIFFPSSSSVAITTAGTEKFSVGTGLVINDGGADFDTRIEGDTDANLVFVDASTDRIGIGTNNPGAKVNLEAADNVSEVRLSRASTNIWGSIQQRSTSGALGLAFNANDGNASTPGFVWRTATDGSTFTERMVLNTTGLGIGTTSPGALLHTYTAAQESVRFARNSTASSAYLTFYANNSSSAQVQYAGILGDVASSTAGSHGGNLLFYTTGSGTSAERVRITSGGDLLVGGTTAESKLNVYSGGSTFSSGTMPAGMTIYGATTDGQGSMLSFKAASGDQGIAGIAGLRSSGYQTELRFYTNNTNSQNAFTERARIASNGFVHVDPAGSYSAIGAFPSLSAQSYHTIQANFNDRTLAVLNANTGGTAGAISTQVLTGASYQLQGFLDSNVVFLVAANGNVTNTNNSYGQISDIKTKQDVVDAASQWDDIKGLRVRKFRFKADPSGPLQIGVVAQELEQISPGLISESPDYEEFEVTDEEGNVKKERQPTGTVTKSVKYSVLYMKAIKALQEAMTRIEELEAEMAALKGSN